MPFNLIKNRMLKKIADDHLVIKNFIFFKMESVEEIMKRAYDKFNITLDRIQILFSSSGNLSLLLFQSNYMRARVTQ
jgi:hypothetical protein